MSAPASASTQSDISGQLSPTTSTAFRLDKPFAVSVVTLIVTIAIVFHSAIAWLIQFWWNVKEYSHGFLIPLIAAYLIWTRRDLLKRVPIRPSIFWGGVAIAGSLVLYLAGQAGGFRLGEAIALLLLLPGIVLFALGWQFLRALAVPLIYLQFMVPWTTELVDRIRLPFQLVSAGVGTRILRLLGFAVLQVEQYITLPHISMDVAPQCSGVGFLMSVIALATVLVYLTQKTWVRACVVVASVALITIATNGVRVAIAGILGEFYGVGMLHGPAHIFQGFFVEVVGVFVLLLLNWRISRLPSQEPLLCRRLKIGAAGTDLRRPSRARVLVLCLILLATGVYGSVFAHPRPVQLSQRLAGFPLVIGDWTGATSDWIKGSDLFPGASDELTRAYYDRSGRRVCLYIGYFAAQRQSISLVNFQDRPLWNESSQETTHLAAGPQRINRSLLVLDSGTYNALFWYELGTTTSNDRNRTKLHQISDVILHGQNNGAVIILATPKRLDPKTADEILLPFVKAVMPELKNYLH